MNELEWISVEDRLPDKQNIYLTSKGDDFPQFTSYFPDSKLWRRYGATVNPAYWMDVPKSPTKEAPNE